MRRFIPGCAIALALGVLAMLIPATALAPPTFNWLTTAGSGGNDSARSVAMRSDGSSYIAGLFSNTVAFGSTNLLSAGLQDVFLVKMSSTGTVEWALGGGGASSETSADVAVLPNGDAIVTGTFSGTATIFGTSLTASGISDIFVAKVNADGTVAWVVRGGGSGTDSATAIATASDSFAVITGVFSGTGVFGSTSLTSAGGNDLFVARIDSSGAFEWAVSGGSNLVEAGGGVAVTADASAVLVDGTAGATGGTFFGSSAITTAGSSDGIIARLNATTGALVWARSVGGTSADTLRSIAAGPDGTAIFTGEFTRSATFGTVTLTSSDTTSTSVVVGTIDAAGDVIWATWGGGTGVDLGYDIAARSDGSSVVAGQSGSGSTITFGSLSASSGSGDGFVAVLSPAGVPWAVGAVGGTGVDEARGVAAGSVGAVRLAGSFTGTATFGSTSVTSAGGSDAFVTSLTTPVRATLTPTLSAPGAGWSVRSPIQVTYTLPEAGASGSLTLRQSGGGTWTLGLTPAALTAGTHTVAVHTGALLTDTTKIASATPSTVIPDGTYTVGLTYEDVALDPAASAEVSGVVFDTVTSTPTLTSPATGAHDGTVGFAYTLPEAGSSGSLTLSDGTNSWVLTLGTSGLTAGSHSFTLDLASAIANRTTESGNRVQSQSPTGRVPDGTYSVTLSYADSVGNAVATATRSNVTIDSVTQAPGITAPAAGSAYRGTFNVAYTLPEAGSAATITLASPSRTVQLDLVTGARSAGAHTVTINPADPVGGSSSLITAATPSGPIPDGTYTVSVGYSDALGNAVASASSGSVTIDNVTSPAVLTAPASFSSGSTVLVDYTLPEAAIGAPTLTFASPDGTWTLALSATAAGRRTFTINPQAPVGVGVSSISPVGPIPPGVYVVTLSYGDVLGNPVVQVQTGAVRIVEPAPPASDPPASPAPQSGSAAPSTPASPAPAKAASPACSGSKRQVALCKAKARLSANLAGCKAKPVRTRPACTKAARTRHAAAVRVAMRLR